MSVKCNTCGSELVHQVNFCTRCGAPIYKTQLPSSSLDIKALEDAVLTEVACPLTPPDFGTIASAQRARRETKALVVPSNIAPAVKTEAFTVVAEALVPVAAPTVTSMRATVRGIDLGELAIDAPPRPRPFSLGARVRLAAFGLVCFLALATGVAVYSSSHGSPELAAKGGTSGAAVATQPMLENKPVLAQNATPSISVVSAPEIKMPTAKAEKPKKADTENITKVNPPSPESVEPSNNMRSPAEYIARGNSQLSSKHYQEALNEYRKVQTLDPTNRDVFYLMGTAYQQMGQLDQALAAYRECTAGVYASVAANHVRTLEKKRGRSQ